MPNSKDAKNTDTKDRRKTQKKTASPSPVKRHPAIGGWAGGPTNLGARPRPPHTWDALEHVSGDVAPQREGLQAEVELLCVVVGQPGAEDPLVDGQAEWPLNLWAKPFFLDEPFLTHLSLTRNAMNICRLGERVKMYIRVSLDPSLKSCHLTGYSTQ